MYRRAYVLLVGVAVLMGVLAVVIVGHLDQPLIDPEGNFLGPSWLRLPLLLLGALLLDMLPRTLWISRAGPRAMPAIVRERWRTHWTRERMHARGARARLLLHHLRQLPEPQVVPARSSSDHAMYDRELHMLDRALFFGHDPADVLHDVLGTDRRRALPVVVYLSFLPLVPLIVTAWLVWSRNLSFGYWFVTVAVHRLDPRHAVLLRAAHARPGLRVRLALQRPRRTPAPPDLMDSLVNAAARRPLERRLEAP